MKLVKSSMVLVLVIGLSFWTILPLFHNGFFPMHDNTQIQRVYEMGKALGDGMLPVRWVSDLGYGYGYPIFTFYAPLAYYVGGLFTFVATPLIATKIMIGIGILLSGVFMYLFAKEILGTPAGIAAAVLYLYAPYHAVDIYVRGDIAELWAYAFIPLAWYGFWKLSEKGVLKNILFAAIGFSGIILSHNLTALMIVPFVVAFASIAGMMSQHKLRAFRSMFFAFLLGLGLSAFYFVPVFGEMKYTNVLSQVGGGADFHDHFVCLMQLWQSPWGYGGSAKGCLDGLSFMIGKPQILLAMLSLFVVPLLWRRNKKIGGVVLFSILSFLLACFLMLSPSVFIWDLFKPMAFFQYPWRFLLLASFFSSLLGGAVISVLEIFVKKIGQKILAIVIVIGVIILSNKYFLPKSYAILPNNWSVSQQTIFNSSKISDEYMPKNFIKPLSLEQIPTSLIKTNSAPTSILINKTQEKKLVVDMPQAGKVLINIAYFPAWKAKVDGQEVPLSQTKKGMVVPLPQGTHILDIFYQETPWELVGDILSLTSIVIFILVIIKRPVGKLYGSKST